jgi:type II secretory pathway pseudopilin PulG
MTDQLIAQLVTGAIVVIICGLLAAVAWMQAERSRLQAERATAERELIEVIREEIQTHAEVMLNARREVVALGKALKVGAE